MVQEVEEKKREANDFEDEVDTTRDVFLEPFLRVWYITKDYETVCIKDNLAEFTGKFQFSNSLSSVF